MIASDLVLLTAGYLYIALPCSIYPGRLLHPDWTATNLTRDSGGLRKVQKCRTACSVIHIKAGECSQTDVSSCELHLSPCYKRRALLLKLRLQRMMASIGPCPWQKQAMALQMSFWCPDRAFAFQMQPGGSSSLYWLWWRHNADCSHSKSFVNCG